MCSSSSIPVQLHFEALLRNPTLRRRTRRAVRVVSKDLEAKLKENLKAEREAYMMEHPSFRMLGSSFVCPDSAIDKICHDAKFIVSIEDLGIIHIQSDVKARFLRVILHTLSVT